MKSIDELARAMTTTIFVPREDGIEEIELEPIPEKPYSGLRPSYEPNGDYR